MFPRQNAHCRKILYDTTFLGQPHHTTKLTHLPQSKVKQSVNLYSAYSKRSLMCLIHFVINISQKCMSSADVWKYRDSVLGHEDCLAANSKSTGSPEKSANDQNCSIDSAVWPTFADWQNADVDGQWLLLWVYKLSIKYGGAVLWRHRYNHEHCELKSYSIGDIKPVELVMH